MYHWFPPFTALGTRTNVVSTTLVASPYLIFSLFSLFEVPPPTPKRPQLTFLFWEVLRVDFQYSLPKASRCSFSNLPFWLLHLLSFSLNRQIPPCQVERSSATFLHGPPPCIPQGTKLLFMKCWFLNHQPFSEPWATNGTCLSSFLVCIIMLPWAVPISTDHFLHFSRIPAF